MKVTLLALVALLATNPVFAANFKVYFNCKVEKGPVPCEALKTHVVRASTKLELTNSATDAILGVYVRTFIFANKDVRYFLYFRGREHLPNFTLIEAKPTAKNLAADLRKSIRPFLLIKNLPFDETALHEDSWNFDPNEPFTYANKGDNEHSVFNGKKVISRTVGEDWAIAAIAAPGQLQWHLIPYLESKNERRVEVRYAIGLPQFTPKNGELQNNLQHSFQAYYVRHLNGLSLSGGVDVTKSTTLLNDSKVDTIGSFLLKW